MNLPTDQQIREAVQKHVFESSTQETADQIGADLGLHPGSVHFVNSNTVEIIADGKVATVTLHGQTVTPA